MNTKIGLLGVILLLQLLLVVGVYVWREDTPLQTQLLTLDTQQVMQMSIDDRDNTVVLDRVQEGWQVSGFGADEGKVQDILSQLADLDAPWPVADSAGSVARFETAQDNYQRRVVLNDDQGENLGTLLFGTSPGYQRTHARNVADNRVYSVALSNFELGVNLDDWLDKGVLALEQAPSAVTIELQERDGEAARTIVLNKVGDVWMVDGEAADADRVQTYVNRFTTLQVLGIASEADVADAELLAQIRSDDERLTLYKNGDEYLIDGQSNSYRLASYIAEQLLMRDTDFTPPTPVIDSSDEGLEAPGS